MSKFHVLWELDTTKLPDKPEERISIFNKLLNMVKEDLEIEGKTTHKTDWGIYPGGDAGYGIYDGTEHEVALELMKYSPYVKFKVYPVLSVYQEFENLEKISRR